MLTAPKIVFSKSDVGKACNMIKRKLGRSKIVLPKLPVPKTESGIKRKLRRTKAELFREMVIGLKKKLG